jgi:hypothetical protein
VQSNLALDDLGAIRSVSHGCGVYGDTGTQPLVWPGRYVVSRRPDENVGD